MSVQALLSRLGTADGATALRGFIERQRWFGGRGRNVTTVSVDDAIPVRKGTHELWTVLVRLGFAGGETEVYHLPLACRPLTDAAVREPDDPRLVSICSVDGTEIAVYDSMTDGDSMNQLWSALAASERHAGDHGELRFRLLGELSSDPDDEVTVRPLAKEQSNSAAVRGDRELLKCLRRVVSGSSPELEMTAALSAAGFDAVPKPLAVAEYVDVDGVATLLLLVQPFLHNGTEGLALALTSLRDFYANAEETGDTSAATLRRATHEQGATFIPEAVRIGEVTARMHLAMLSDAVPEPMRAQPVDAARLRRWSALMIEELDKLLERDEPAIEPLRARRDAVAAEYAAITGLEHGGMSIRVHGDYHLGQLLRTDSGWVVIDFEGEPVRSIEERRGHSSPLNDVAGMLRSLDYAAALALADRGAPGDPGWERLREAGDAWSEVNRSVLWDAYTAGVAGSALVPPGTGASVLRRAFELRKAVYEVGYELGHRPDWVGIPLRFLLGVEVRR